MRQRTRLRGFTLAEVLFSLSLLAVAATALAGLYGTGMQSAEIQTTQLRLDSELRSEMEFRLADGVEGAGSREVLIEGQTYIVQWSVVLHDIDGDGSVDAHAKLVTVSAEQRSLTSIIVDHNGQVRKL